MVEQPDAHAEVHVVDAAAPETRQAEQPPVPGIERIAIIFVHGIGEQRRFTHLDTEVRPLLDALSRRPANTTIEISAGAASTLRADQDTWSTQDGAPVRALVRDENGTHALDFHEVWWADVNEEYTFKKQFRFWIWGLGMWWMPFQPNMRPTAVMRAPVFPQAGRGMERKGNPLVVRIQLYFTSNLFLMGAFSVGLLAYVVKRVFGYEPPDFIRVLVNYLSAVRLYSQAERAGGGFLDAYKEPPRVSVRRRMIRTIVDVALQDYDRWYIFGHSLGSVVAFNGVMENNLAIPNYLDQKRWRALRAKDWAGAGQNNERVSGKMLPARPLWLADNEVVYRERLFEKFAGFLTYGSPLDKFAMLWPAQVPINFGEPIKFHPRGGGGERDPEWINVYDQTDPVGASLQAYGTPEAQAGILSPKNYGYCAGAIWLVSHLKYLRVHQGRRDELSDALMQWVLSGGSFRAEKQPYPWYVPEGGLHRLRRLSRTAQQIGGYLILLVLAAITLPFIIKAIGELADKIYALSPAVPAVVAAPITWVFHLIESIVVFFVSLVSIGGTWLGGILVAWLPSWLAGLLTSDFSQNAFWVALGVAVVTGIAGLIGHSGGFDEPDKNSKTFG